jgi:ubiquinone/menaquinone biosynthesis C-methylase UbiE
VKSRRSLENLGKLEKDCGMSVMNIYSRFIFPRLIDRVMGGEDLAKYRREVLQFATGKVLEIGFGTGLNLPYYPKEKIDKLATVDVNPGMNKLAATRIANSNIQVDVRILSGEQLPFDDASFDTVVSTWTLCSIKAVDNAIAEIYRVLKPGGKFLFIEHGLSDEPHIQRCQHALNPIQKIIADGCHLDRDIKALIGQYFNTLDVKEFYDLDRGKIGGYFYQGMAIK